MAGQTSAKEPLRIMISPWVGGGHDHPDHDLAGAWVWLVDLDDLQNVGPAVSIEPDGTGHRDQSSYGSMETAPSCCRSDSKLATPQCSTICPSRTRIASTVSNWISRPVGAMPKNGPSCVPWYVL